MRPGFEWRRSWRLQLAGVVASLLVFVGLVCLAKDSNPAPPAAVLPIPEAQFLAELAATLGDGGGLAPGDLRVTHYDGDRLGLRLTLASSTPRLRPADAELLTVRLVNSARQVLVAHGYDPKGERSSISANAMQAMARARGRESLFNFGSAHYDCATDRVSFEADQRFLSWSAAASAAR